MTYLTGEQTDKLTGQLTRAIDDIEFAVGDQIFHSPVDRVDSYEQIGMMTRDSGFRILLEDGTEMNVTVQAFK